MRVAQTLAWSPLLFHAAKLLRDRGILALLSSRTAGGLTIDELTSRVKMTRYAVTVLVEAGLAAQLDRQIHVERSLFMAGAIAAAGV